MTEETYCVLRSPFIFVTICALPKNGTRTTHYDLVFRPSSFVYFFISIC
jgi:hypothetical protein